MGALRPETRTTGSWTGYVKASVARHVFFE